MVKYETHFRIADIYNLLSYFCTICAHIYLRMRYISFLSTYMMPVKDPDQLILPRHHWEISCYCTFVRSNAHNNPFSNRFKSVKSFEKCTYIKHSHFVSIVTNPCIQATLQRNIQVTLQRINLSLANIHSCILIC